VGFEKINNNLVRKLRKKYPKMFEYVLKQRWCDIDLDFMGFVDTYYYLSKIIPKHWTVIDFGCAYNPQAYFFRNHKSFIGVDCSTEKQFQFKNTILFKGTIADYLKQNPIKGGVFAICNNVPSEETKMIREYYPNCFIYYINGVGKEITLRKKEISNK